MGLEGNNSAILNAECPQDFCSGSFSHGCSVVARSWKLKEQEYCGPKSLVVCDTKMRTPIMEMEVLEMWHLSVTEEPLSAEIFMGHFERHLAKDSRFSLIGESVELKQPASKEWSTLISLAKRNSVP